MKTEKPSPISPGPTKALEAAIKKLAVFVRPEATSLEVKEDGSLIASPPTNPLERVMSLAHCYIGPLLSDQVKQEQAKKLKLIKQEILHARDILKSHSSLIEKLKEGDPSQQRLAHSALETIQTYNAVINQDFTSLTSKYNFYNYERNCLLSDSEIKNQAIDLPQTYSIKFDSHSISPVQNTITQLSGVLKLETPAKKMGMMSPTHKRTDQFMIDRFRVKAIRMLQTHQGKNPISETLVLVNQTPIEIGEENGSDLIVMRQILELHPGSTITLSGSFRQNVHDPKFMSMPILDSFRLTSERSHSGFPYPSQHSGWALADKLVDAQPLRTEQTPFFHQLQQRKKKLAHSLLYDEKVIAHSKQVYKAVREIYDANKDHYLPLHRELQLHLLWESGQSEQSVILYPFYNAAASAPSTFDLLTRTQQRLLDLFITLPSIALEEEWIGEGSSPLRTGTPEEKYQYAKHLLQQKQTEALHLLSHDNSPTGAYLRLMGPILGNAAQAILLQYQSEKMGFAPPTLSDFERKLQTCAFHQMITFLNEFKQIDPSHHIAKRYEEDLSLFQSKSIDKLNLKASQLTKDLESYFNSRFKQ